MGGKYGAVEENSNAKVEKVVSSTFAFQFFGVLSLPLIQINSQVKKLKGVMTKNIGTIRFFCLIMNNVTGCFVSPPFR